MMASPKGTEPEHKSHDIKGTTSTINYQTVNNERCKQNFIMATMPETPETMGQNQGAPARSGRSIEEYGQGSLAPGHQGQPGFAPGHHPGLIPPPPGPPYPGIAPWTVPFPPRVGHPAAPNGYYPPHRSSKNVARDGPKNGHWVPAYRMPPPVVPPHPVMVGRGGPPFYYHVRPPPVMYGPPPGMVYPGGPHPFGYPRFFGPGAPDMAPGHMPDGTSSRRNSVVISTFPDPSDDQIRRGGKSKTNRISTRADVIATDSDNEINNNDDKGDVKDRNRNSAKVVGGQTIVPESIKQIFDDPNGNSEMLPNQQREAHFVTYIKDGPVPASPPTPPATPEEVTMRKKVLVSQLPRHVVHPEVLEGFVEVGEAEGHVIRYMIDADRSQQTVTLPGERVPLSVHRVQYLSSDHEEQTATLTFTDTDQMDVVMCFDSTEVGLATVLKDELYDSQLTVCMGSLSALDTSGEDLANTARAVFNARTLVVLLSPTSAQNRQVRDLVSLATLTNRPVLPVAVGPRSSIVQLLGTELKLQLGRCRWTELALGGDVVLGAGLGDLVTTIREQTNALRKYNVIDEDYGQVSSCAVHHHRAMQLDKQKDEVKIASHLEGEGDSPREEGQVNDFRVQDNFVMAASEFWDKTFPQNIAVPWHKFRAELRSHYLGQFSAHLPRSCMDRLMKALRESLVQKDSKGTEYTTRDTFIIFCTENGFENDVWQAICDVARYYQAVIDVFDKDSTIRLVALEGIASYGSPVVVSGLREVIQDGDPQIRCLAVEALSRCMLHGDQISFTSIMAALDDGHWMVRKVACEGMARLGALQAIDRLRRLGRTDTNAQVRAASTSALAEIEAGIPHTASRSPV